MSPFLRIEEQYWPPQSLCSGEEISQYCLSITENDDRIHGYILPGTNEFPQYRAVKTYKHDELLHIFFSNTDNSTLQMFTGIYRDSAGGFLQYLQGKPCNIYRLQGDCRENL